MSYIKQLFDVNFMEYASYVIKDRAIPDLEDGLKPVQRRILHSLFEMDDGKFHKVANVVGHCMKYHPHGDASIYSALVVLANKDLLIDTQGNFGNIFTGDEASAARYIECRTLPFAKKVLYNPELTEAVPSYDGRNQEPVVFPAKIPLVLVHGAEGIAVGMSTRILPHNLIEVLEAMKAALLDKPFELYPDFPTGGFIDVGEYNEGNGKIVVRAKLDTKDPKRILVRELPFGSTTESLIASVENAARKNKIKIAGISDFTTSKVEIEIRLARGVTAEETVDALYAFTDCQSSLSCNLLVIHENKPLNTTVPEIIKYHAQKLTGILKAELKLEEKKLLDKLHARTLEQIFIEERIYKRIEQMETQERVVKAVLDGFKPFAKVIKRDVTPEDVETLLKIPIRRISLYDINKAKKEMEEIRARLKQIKQHLAKLVEYAMGVLDGFIREGASTHERKTKVTTVQKIDVREVAQRNLKLRHDPVSGYIGHEVSGGQALFDVSPYDRVLALRPDGHYSVVNAPGKYYVGKTLMYCGIAEKEELSTIVFTIVYREKDGGTFSKRFKIEQFIIDKDYALCPEDSELLFLTTEKKGKITVSYIPKPRQRVKEQEFKIEEFLVKGLKAQGVRISPQTAETVDWSKGKAEKVK